MIKQQKRLGPEAIWKGIITQQWGDYQEHWYRQRGAEKQYTGTLWTGKLVMEIYRFVTEIWKHQNEKMHNSNEMKPHREKLQKEVERLYTKYRETPEILACIYKHSLKKLLGKSIGYLQKWHEIMEGMETTEKILRLQREGRDIRKYLPMQEKPPE